MLTATFCHLPGLSLRAERMLWSRGVVCWGDLKGRATELLSAPKARRVVDGLVLSEAALRDGDLGYFAERLPDGELVRLYPDLREDLAYLDIETTGLSRADVVTTAVLHRAGEVKVYVRGVNLGELEWDMGEVRALVTFNGRRFDLPFLAREFGRGFALYHLDLWRVLRARGYRGGLKTCERAMGVSRVAEAGVDGREAIRLWQRFQEGDRGALARILRYNLEDALVLERLVLSAYNEAMSAWPVFRPVPVPDQRTVAKAALAEIERICSLAISPQDVG